MDSMQKPADDEGVTHFQRLKADQFDVVLGSPATRRAAAKPRSSHAGAVLLAGLALLALLVYIAVARGRSEPPSTLPIAALELPAPTQEAAPAGLVRASSTALVVPEVVTQQAKADAAPVANPQPLDSCMKNGTVMNDAVAKCRFGNAPKAETASAPAQGMVSARYMAQFKAEQAQPAKPSGPAYYVATVEIREYKGRNRYRAQWKIFDNEIDNASVCANFPGESVEHRECRKAAAVYFKESCQEWSKRADNDRDPKTQQAQQRYCQANKTFVAAD